MSSAAKKHIIKRLKDNPYSTYDTGLSAKYWMWEQYREPISQTQDERPYLSGALAHLAKHGRLIEEYKSIDDGLKDPDDDMPYRAFISGNEHTSLYLYRDNLIQVRMEDDEMIRLCFYYPTSKTDIVSVFAKWVAPLKGESRVSILIKRNGGVVANKVSFPPPVIKDLEFNYGTGFLKTHEKIMDKLNRRDGKLFIFSGVTGSGKSSYLKHLLSICDREFIFVPVSMAPYLAGEDFLSLLMQHKEAVLILEDAEQIIQPRGSGQDDSTISTLLNISDGLLGSLLRVTCILTMNASQQTIDSAVLRRGRLALRHDFGELSVPDAKRLAKSLGKDETLITKPTSLADIYGSEDDTGQQPEVHRAMGFSALLSSQNPKRGD